MTASQNSIQHILLADDDKDDCLLFEEALKELSLPTHLTCVYNGEALMDLLKKADKLPHILFLDLNMPRKNGFACLTEIKKSENLKNLPVVILSTSFEQNNINLLYKNGAQFYMRKPNEFALLKNLIFQAITLSEARNFSQPPKEEFLLADVNPIK